MRVRVSHPTFLHQIVKRSRSRWVWMVRNERGGADGRTGQSESEYGSAERSHVGGRVGPPHAEVPPELEHELSQLQTSCGHDQHTDT
jgi:hypothetical protein